MRKVAWSRDALNDLGNILDFYAEADEPFANRLVDEIDAAGEALGRYLTARPGRNLGTFEKSLPRLRYIIVYELDAGQDGTVRILHIIHSARNWQRGEWPT